MVEVLKLKARLCTETQRSSKESAAHAGHVVMSSAMSAPHPQAPIAIPEALTGANIVHDSPDSQPSPLIVFIREHVIICVNKTPEDLQGLSASSLHFFTGLHPCNFRVWQDITEVLMDVTKVGR